MLKRLLQLLILVSLIYAGVQAWHELVRPPTDPLDALADAPLRELFGPAVTYDRPIRFHPETGAELHNLRVPNTSGLLESDGAGGLRLVDGLFAKRVRVTHDPLALAAGRYRPLLVEIEGVRIHTRETESGIAADFPLDVHTTEGSDGAAPRIDVRDLVLNYRALADSQRLRPSATIRLGVDALGVAPGPDGRLRVNGRMRTYGLGQDETPISLTGTIDANGSQFALEARWDPLELTAELLDLLPPDLGSKLGASGIRSGSFAIRLARAGGADEGALEPQIEWHSEVELTVPDLPGMDAIDATTREQLTRLFGRAALHVELQDGKVNIRSIVTELAGGRVQATGWIVQETGEFAIDFDIRDLRLEDEAVRNALGEGADIYDEFDPRGIVDAIGRVTRTADGVVAWSVDVLLENVDLAYVGSPGPDGVRVGFPYRVSEATGRVRIDGDGVVFDDIVGFHRGAEVVIRGNAGRSWTGGETGIIRFTDDGPELSLTVIATHVPVDEEFLTAIRQSEFADILGEFEIEGVIDRVEIDLFKTPKIERAVKAELRLTLEGEQFRYLPFPLPLEDVRGRLTMHRPLLDDMATRGRIYKFDVTGWGEGAPIHVWAEIIEHEDRGRLHVEAEGIPLAGKLGETVRTSVTTKDDVGEIWTWLGPRGKANVKVSIPLAEEPERLRLEADLLGATIQLGAEGQFPIDVTELDGRMLLEDGVVTLTDMRGQVGGAPVRISGTLAGGVDGAWDVHARIDHLRLTGDLMRSLEALIGEGDLLPGGLSFESGSSMDLALRLQREPGDDAELELSLEATAIDAILGLPDGTAIAVSGERLTSERGVVTANGIHARGEGIQAEIRHARVVPGGDTRITGRFHAMFDDFVVTPGFRDLLPDSIADVLEEWTANRTLRSKSFLVDVPEDGPITMEGDLTLVPLPDSPPDEGARGQLELMPLRIATHPSGGVVLSGLVQLGGFSIDAGVALMDLRGAIEVEHLHLDTAKPEGRGRIATMSGRIADLSVSHLGAPVDWRDGILRIPAIGGLLCGGEMIGNFTMHTSAPVSYEGRATVRNFSVAKLRADLAPTGPPYAGIGTAVVTFQNRGGSLNDLTAAGTVAIRKGRLGDLPFIANIFTLTDELAGVEERPQFERADVVFTLKNEVFTFRRFDLAGPLFDLPGSGTLDLAGIIDLRFTPDLLKGLLVPGVMQVPGVGPLLRGVLPERIMYAVRVHGDIDSAEPELVMLPGLGMSRRGAFEGVGARELPRRRLPRLFR